MASPSAGMRPGPVRQSIASWGGETQVRSLAFQVRSNTIANTQFLGPLQGEKAFDIDSDTAICVVQSEEVQFDNNTLAGKRIVHMKSSNGERR